MVEAIMWGVTVASLTATVGNIYYRRWCFAIWAVTNAAWTAYDIYKVAYPQAALQAVYFGLALWGLRVWKKGKHP